MSAGNGGGALVIHVVIDAIVALAALVAILDYFGVKPKEPLGGIAMPLSRKWKLAIMLGLTAAALGMSGYGFYRALKPKIEKVTEIVKVPVTPDYRKWASESHETISHRAYLNETVEVDGKTFDHCTFENVTFLYHGLAWVYFVKPGFKGIIGIETDNMAAIGIAKLSYYLRSQPGNQSLGVFAKDAQTGEMTPLYGPETPLKKSQ
jgi:hypothetical protein